MANKEPDEISESAAWKQLSNAVALGAKQDQIVWTVFGVFWAANAVLLVALFATGDLPERRVGIIASAFGIALSAVWWRVERRAIEYLGAYEEVIRRLERRLLGEPSQFALSRGLNEELFEKKVQGSSVRPLVEGVCIVFIGVWLGALIFFVLSALLCAPPPAPALSPPPF